MRQDHDHLIFVTRHHKCFGFFFYIEIGPRWAPVIAMMQSSVVWPGTMQCTGDFGFTNNNTDMIKSVSLYQFLWDIWMKFINQRFTEHN